MESNATITAVVQQGGTIQTTVETGSSITATVTGGAQGLQGVAGPTGATGATGPQGPSGTLKTYFDVTNYGAVGDGNTDDTAAIQAAIAAAQPTGGIIFFPFGVYSISSALTCYTGVSFLGEGSEASFIQQTSTTANALVGVDVASISIQGILIEGPATGSGIGISFTWSAAGNVPYLDFRDVWVRNFGGDGLYLETPIVSHFDRVISQGNGGYGFNFPQAGTSCSFTSCWARQNAKAGYRFYESVYFSLVACAADNNGIGYLVDSAQSIHFSGCGSEGQLLNGGSFNGIGWKITNSSVVTLTSCWITDNRNLGVWVTGGAQVISLNVADNTPHAGATYFIQVDSGCTADIYGLHNTTANSLTTGTTNIYDDGAGGTHSQDVFVNSATATTVPYFNANKALVSSSVTPTELGYVHGVTSSIQNQINAIASADISRVITSVSANTNAAAAALTDYVYLMMGSPTLTLPTAVGNTNRYSVTNVGTGIPLVTTSLGQTINGSPSAALPTPNMSLDFISDNANWHVE